MGASAQRRARWISALVTLTIALSAVVLSAPTARAHDEDVMRIGDTQEIDSLNPFAAVESSSYFLFAHVYDLLVGIGPTLEPVPQLARSWSVSADGLSWTFNLYDNVKWHDNTSFTADDVKFTIEYIQQCQLALFLGYVGDPTADPVYIETVTVASPTQVVMTTNVPKANMLSLFVFILPEHIWSGIACEDAETVANDPPIGTGMYRFVRWEQGSFIEMEINTNYHLIPEVLARKPGMDFVDKIFFQFYTDALPLYNDFRAGDIDATADLTSRQFLELALNIDDLPDVDVVKLTGDDISFLEIGFCVASDAIIGDLEASGDLLPEQGKRHWLMTNLTTRQAIALAIDRQSLVDNAFQGLGRKGESLIPPATPYWHYDVPDSEEYKFNLTAAAALLNDPRKDGFTLRTGATVPGLKGEGLDPAAANNQDAFADIDGDGIREVINTSRVDAEGAPKGNEGILTSPDEMKFGIWIIDAATESQTAADIFLPWLASIGISVQKFIVSEGQLIDISYGADYDLYMWGFGGDVDPDFLLSVLTTDQILGWQDAWYSNPEYDALYAEQQGLVDPAERQAVVHEMQRIAYRDTPYIIYIYQFVTTVGRIDRFTGWGNWSESPGLGLSGFGNSFLMLQLEPVAAGAGGPLALNLYALGGIVAAVAAGIVTAVVVILRRRRREQMPLGPPPPPQPPLQPPQP